MLYDKSGCTSIDFVVLWQELRDASIWVKFNVFGVYDTEVSINCSASLAVSSICRGIQCHSLSVMEFLVTPPQLKTYPANHLKAHKGACLQNITEVGVFLVSQILKGVNHAVISSFSDTSSGHLVTSLVLAAEVPAEVDEDEDEGGVAAEMGGKSSVVCGSFSGLLAS